MFSDLLYEYEILLNEVPGGPPSSHFNYNAPKTPDITESTVRVPHVDLWRHSIESPFKTPFLDFIAHDLFCSAEIGDFADPILSHQDIGPL